MKQWEDLTTGDSVVFDSHIVLGVFTIRIHKLHSGWHWCISNVTPFSQCDADDLEGAKNEALMYTSMYAEGFTNAVYGAMEQ